MFDDDEEKDTSRSSAAAAASVASSSSSGFRASTYFKLAFRHLNDPKLHPIARLTFNNLVFCHTHNAISRYGTGAQCDKECGMCPADVSKLPGWDAPPGFHGSQSLGGFQQKWFSAYKAKHDALDDMQPVSDSMDELQASKHQMAREKIDNSPVESAAWDEYSIAAWHARNKVVQMLVDKKEFGSGTKRALDLIKTYVNDWHLRNGGQTETAGPPTPWIYCEEHKATGSMFPVADDPRTFYKPCFVCISDARSTYAAESDAAAPTIQEGVIEGYMTSNKDRRSRSGAMTDGEEERE